MADKVGFRNNALAELAQVLQAADTELFMSTEHGDRFTPPDGTDYIVATLGDPEAEHEIVHLSAVAFVGDGLARFQVVRNREATHRSEPWPAGTPVQGLLTAGGLNAMRGGPVVGFETDATGSLRAGAAATAAGVGLGDNGAHIAVMPSGNRRYAVEYMPDESVPAGAIVYAGGYSFMALNEGPLGQEPPSLEASPQRSGQVFYAPVGRTDAPKLENHSITLGSEALPGGEGALVIGAMATVAELASDGMALGQGAASLQVEALAVGGWSMAAGVRAVAIGGGALAMTDASIAIGTKVEIAHSWRIAGVPTLGEGIAGVDPLSDFQAVAIAPDATVALAHTDIGVVRTWQPLMTVRSGDVVMPTVAGDYAYVAEAPFFAQVADNTVQTGSEEPLFNIEAWPAYENNVIWRPIRAGLAQSLVFPIPEHQMFYVTEIGFMSTDAGAVTTGAKLSFGSVDAPALVLNDVELPGAMGANRMHRIPIEEPIGLTGTAAITLTRLVAGGHYQGRFYLRATVTRTRG